MTAEDIRNALLVKYTEPDWQLCFEVGNGTGSNLTRYADAVAICTYPSRGYETIGIEIKVSKADLRKEIENPSKADEVGRFCDKWFLAVPKGLCDGEDIPASWGVMELRGDKLAVKKAASVQEKAGPTPAFLAAMLRGAVRRTRMQAADTLKASYDKGVADQIRATGDAEYELANLRERLDRIYELTGIDLPNWQPAEEVARTLKSATEIRRAVRGYGRLKDHVKNVLEVVEQLDEAIEKIGVPLQ